MRNIFLSIPVIFYIRAYAKELLMTPIGNTHNLMHKVDELIDSMQDQRLPHHADLDNTTLGKPGCIAISLQSR